MVKNISTKRIEDRERERESGREERERERVCGKREKREERESAKGEIERERRKKNEFLSEGSLFIIE